MNFIRLYKQGGDCAHTNREEYLLVLARDLDGNGEWLPAKFQSFRTLIHLQEALREIVATTDGVVIQASRHFGQLAQELGLPLLTAEWGRL